MKKIAIIAASLLAFVSCVKETYDYVPKDKKPNLRNGDTVYFVNHQDKSLVDTFVIQISTIYDVVDKIHYFEATAWRYQNKNKSFFYGLSTSYGTSCVASSQQWDYMHYSHTTTSEIDIRNTKFPVVVYAANNNSDGTVPNTIYYSIKKGIVRYDYSDTNYYERKL